MHTQQGNPLTRLASWIGGWCRLLLLALAIVAVVGGFFWERERGAPVPPQAEQVTTQLGGDIRQTSFRYPGTVEEVRDFYRQAFADRGWRYCGTQATDNCSNMIRLAGRSGDEIDVYRQANDVENTGPTMEVSPILDPNGQTFVTVFETRQRYNN